MPPTAPPSNVRPSVHPTPALHAEASGAGPRLVLAHGFTQTGRVWGGLDADLARDHEVVSVDMPGHAGSTEVAATLVDAAPMLVAIGGRATYLGYSMGARFCLHLALAHPAVVENLVLISGTAGIDDLAERRSRREADEALADELDPPDGSGKVAVPVETFIRRWLDAPMFADISPEADGHEERLRNSGSGLASSLRLAGTGTQQPLWAQLSGLAMPILIVSGEGDEKFTALGGRMAGAIGSNATHSTVEGAGHSPHLEQPRRVAALIRSHMARVAPS